MPRAYFADSSALVKRHVEEIGSIWFSNVADEKNRNTIIISRLSITEVFSAFTRRRRELSLSRIDYQKIAKKFAEVCNNEYQIMEITENITRGSRELLEKYPLRASDSIQLASALFSNENLKREKFSELIFLASDKQLLDAAADEDLQNDDPQKYP